MRALASLEIGQVSGGNGEEILFFLPMFGGIFAGLNQYGFWTSTAIGSISFSLLTPIFKAEKASYLETGLFIAALGAFGTAVCYGIGYSATPPDNPQSI